MSDRLQDGWPILLRHEGAPDGLPVWLTVEGADRVAISGGSAPTDATVTMIEGSDGLWLARPQVAQSHEPVDWTDVPDRKELFQRGFALANPQDRSALAEIAAALAGHLNDVADIGRARRRWRLDVVAWAVCAAAVVVAVATAEYEYFGAFGQPVSERIRFQAWPSLRFALLGSFVVMVVDQLRLAWQADQPQVRRSLAPLCWGLLCLALAYRNVRAEWLPGAAVVAIGAHLSALWTGPRGTRWLLLVSGLLAVPDVGRLMPPPFTPPLSLGMNASDPRWSVYIALLTVVAVILAARTVGEYGGFVLRRSDTIVTALRRRVSDAGLRGVSIAMAVLLASVAWALEAHQQRDVFSEPLQWVLATPIDLTFLAAAAAAGAALVTRPAPAIGAARVSQVLLRAVPVLTAVIAFSTLETWLPFSYPQHSDAREWLALFALTLAVALASAIAFAAVLMRRPDVFPANEPYIAGWLRYNRLVRQTIFGAVAAAAVLSLLFSHSNRSLGLDLWKIASYWRFWPLVLLTTGEFSPRRGLRSMWPVLALVLIASLAGTERDLDHFVKSGDSTTIGAVAAAAAAGMWAACAVSRDRTRLRGPVLLTVVGAGPYVVARTGAFDVLDSLYAASTTTMPFQIGRVTPLVAPVVLGGAWILVRGLVRRSRSQAEAGLRDLLDVAALLLLVLPLNPSVLVPLITLDQIALLLAVALMAVARRSTPPTNDHPFPP